MLCLSTFHGNEMVPYSTRRRDAEDVDRPKMITDYNENMGGVDLMDQLLVYYAIGRKSIKWYKRIYWRIVDIAIVNAQILHSICHPLTKMCQKHFRLKLADALVEQHINEKVQSVQSTGNPGRRVSSGQARMKGKHFGQWKTKRGRCTVCGNKKKPDGTSDSSLKNSWAAYGPGNSNCLEIGVID